MRPVTDLAELEALPVGSITAHFWTDGSGPSVYWRSGSKGWTNGDLYGLSPRTVGTEFEGHPLMLVYRPDEP